MMKKFRDLSFLVTVLLFIAHFVVWCNGDDAQILEASLMEKTEQEALYFAIQGFVGKHWNGSDLYPDPCGWTPIQGVSCDLYDGLWYVTDLSIGPIHDNSLECAQNAEFSPHLFTLKHLRALSFFNCFVSPRDHPISIAAQNWELLAGSLESLEFRSNPGVIGPVPSAIGDLRKLQSLVLVGNGLSGDLPGNIGSLVSLRRLVISGNKFTGRIPDSFGGFGSLLIFDLSRNFLSGPLPSSLGNLSSLLKLDLSKNQLGGKIPEEIGNLKNLTLLDLSNNNFSSGLTKSLQEMWSLEELVMSNNPIGGTLLGLEWGHLKATLTVLDLSNTRLNGGIPESITWLERLRFLGLNDNNLSGQVSPRLAVLPNVSAIYLNGNNLTGKLAFSQGFYGKMGRRLGLWNNPNLCFPFATPTSHVPFGVKSCQQQHIITLTTQIGLDANSRLGNGNQNRNGNQNENGNGNGKGDSYVGPMVSLGFSTHFDLWRTLVAQLFIALLLLNLEIRIFGV
ncbi:PREDICTED: piriformospora indica-insensitive protein 2-like [Ipomoea nil]|uniref:piriformospora indica-insensitive protein 2-like n=1 Tax=Ipomoea nil TaxID=35883 RepID=UPI0009014CD6|nr:PREDICTED: piriformospora indica-insensitive protein 2-like [Ipomoea nil]